MYSKCNISLALQDIIIAIFNSDCEILNIVCVKLFYKDSVLMKLENMSLLKFSLNLIIV